MAQIWLEFWGHPGWLVWNVGQRKEQGVDWGGVPSPSGEVWGRKMNFSLEMICLVTSERYFCHCSCHKSVEFSTRNGDLVKCEDVQQCTM